MLKARGPEALRFFLAHGPEQVLIADMHPSWALDLLGHARHRDAAFLVHGPFGRGPNHLGIDVRARLVCGIEPDHHEAAEVVAMRGGQADGPDRAHGIDHISCERRHAVVPLCDGLRLQPEAAIRVEEKRSYGPPCLSSSGMSRLTSWWRARACESSALFRPDTRAHRGSGLTNPGANELLCS